MAWSTGVFTAFLTDALNSTSNGAAGPNIDAGTIKCALFDSTVTPDKTVASASTAYGAGVWAAGHITDTGSSAPNGWPTVGLDLTVTSTFATNVYTFDANDRQSANDVTTIGATCSGCLVYADTPTTPVADPGIAFLSFGGTASVALGRFTVVFNGAGIFTITT